MHFGRRTVPGRVAAAISTTRRELEQKLRRADNDDDRKAALLHELWRRRKQLRAERERNKNAYVLEHLRQGGWGKRDMQKASTTMMHQRHDDGSATTMPDDIGALATKYDREMFTPEPPKDPHQQEREIELDEVTQQSYDNWQWMGGTVTGNMVHRAVQACPARRTCADDGVVAEAWAVAAETDPRICGAFAWAANPTTAAGAQTKAAATTNATPTTTQTHPAHTTTTATATDHTTHAPTRATETAYDGDAHRRRSDNQPRYDGRRRRCRGTKNERTATTRHEDARRRKRQGAQGTTTAAAKAAKQTRCDGEQAPAAATATTSTTAATASATTTTRAQVRAARAQHARMHTATRKPDASDPAQRAQAEARGERRDAGDRSNHASDPTPRAELRHRNACCVYTCGSCRRSTGQKNSRACGRSRYARSVNRFG